MSETPVAATPVFSPSTLKLRKVGAWRSIRVLAWDGTVLYGCRGYRIVRMNAGLHGGANAVWEDVAYFRPIWWRKLTSRSTLANRLMRDGFHALAILDDGANDRTMIGAVPGALVTRTSGDNEFQVTHRILRGTRPLHITAVPSGKIYWGEYFDNRERAEVHIYVSTDRGLTWQIAYTFPAGSIRHVHNIVYDRWADCLWILTGDDGAECKVLRASCDLGSVGSTMDVVLAGSQQVRAVAAIPTPEGLVFFNRHP